MHKELFSIKRLVDLLIRFDVLRWRIFCVYIVEDEHIECVNEGNKQ
jgi:hypothetical protein